MDLKFIPITTNRADMQPYLGHTFCLDIFNVYLEFYNKVPYQMPWIGYFALHNDEVVGVGGFKGAPKNNKVEIAYGTKPEMEGRGYASKICGHLVKMALENNPDLVVIARTLMEENPSTSILRKNNFKHVGVVNDPDDGDVWEWEYINTARD